MTDITRTEPVAGCWIDGTWGWRGTPRVIEIAEAYGMTVEPSIKEQGIYNIVEDADGYDQIVDLSDDAEAWLNEHVAPEGFSFGWDDGEFFLRATVDWEAP